MSPSPESLQERYAAIERVYAQQDWQEVERRSQTLLAELPDEPTHPLRLRLVLLLAHTRLYGTGDPGGAAVLYRAVADAQPEPVLADIAAQGLQQCAELQPTAAPTAAETTAPAAAVAQGTAAMPWLQELGGAEQAPRVEPVEVIEEPELIELALADPNRRDLVTVEDNAGQASQEAPPAPLRWPFMADHQDRRLPGSMPAGPSPQAAPPTSRRQEATEQAAELPIPSASDATGAEPPSPLAGASQPAQGGMPADSKAAAPANPFTPAELAELSRGLLGVSIR